MNIDDAVQRIQSVGDEVKRVRLVAKRAVEGLYALQEIDIGEYTQDEVEELNSGVMKLYNELLAILAQKGGAS